MWSCPYQPCAYQHQSEAASPAEGLRTVAGQAVLEETHNERDVKWPLHQGGGVIFLSLAWCLIARAQSHPAHNSTQPGHAKAAKKHSRHGGS